MDLTVAYDGVKSARRTVVHLLPGIAVVLDEGEFDESEEISLRWHTAVASTPNKQGAFEVKKDDVSLAVQVSVLEGELRDILDGVVVFLLDDVHELRIRVCN